MEGQVEGRMGGSLGSRLRSRLGFLQDNRAQPARHSMHPTASDAAAPEQRRGIQNNKQKCHCQKPSLVRYAVLLSPPSLTLDTTHTDYLHMPSIGDRSLGMYNNTSSSCITKRETPHLPANHHRHSHLSVAAQSIMPDALPCPFFPRT